MAITAQEISKLENDINNKLLSFNAQFVMTVHFSVDRLNDPRNKPPITIEELESIFDRLIGNFISAIVALNDGDTFTISCMNTNINMPCAVAKESQPNGSATHKNILITIMRKRDFYSKDPVVFKV